MDAVIAGCVVLSGRHPQKLHFNSRNEGTRFDGVDLSVSSVFGRWVKS